MSETGTVASTLRGFMRLVIFLGIVGIVLVAYNSWTMKDEEGRVPVSVVITYTPADREVMASWKLGYDVQNHPIDHSPFAAAGAANVGDVIFFVAVPVTGVADMTAVLYVRGKPVKTCDRTQVENSTCTWTVS